MKRILIIVFILATLLTAHSRADDHGTGSPFSFGAGARDLALGGAALTNTDPATAPYWNASLLARAEHFSLGLFYSRLYDSDVAYQYLGVVVPTMDMGGFGLGVFRLGIDGIEKRDDHNLLLGTIDDNRLAFYFAYGRMFARYSLGLALTLEHHSLDNYNATSSPGLNLSISRRFSPRLNWLPEISASLTGHNLLRPSIKLADEDVRYPYSADAGLSIKLLPKPKWNQAITLSARVSKVNLIDPEMAVGLEYSFQEFLQIRGGVRDRKLSFGAGLHFESISFDYALVDRDLGILHMFSLTANFGKSVSERKIIREKKREAEFNELMNRSLINQNSELVSRLVKQGEKLMQASDFAQANVVFERALFLSSGSGLDTNKVYQLASETKARLQEITLKQNFEAYLDSAKTKFGAKDYLNARYFANLALMEFPDSPEAKGLLDRADAAIEQSATKNQVIESRLLLADSLLSYGKSDQALAVLRALSQITGKNERVHAALKKAEFEHWRETASTSFSKADYQSANAALDSALSRFPEHPWCLKLRIQIEQELSHIATAPVKEEKPEHLSQELQKEVSEIYKKGQEFFEQGKLLEAISQWEKVERLAPGYMLVREYLVNAYKFIGVELYSRNQLKDALVIWKKATILAPDNNEIASYIKRTENEIAKLQELSYDSK